MPGWGMSMLGYAALNKSFKGMIPGPTDTWMIGPNTDYDCVPGNTCITVPKSVDKRGFSEISKIGVGDLVLTQVGEYKPVERKFKRSLRDGEKLIKLTVKWRKDRSHKLTLTENHKVLVHRDGRNKWVRAGDVQLSDCMYQRKKKSHNEGSRKVKICENCGRSYTAQGRRFCSIGCRTEWYEKGHNPHLGMKRTKKAKKLMSESAKYKLKIHPELHPSRLVAQRGYCTSYEEEVGGLLDLLDVEYETQRVIGSRVVDFYCPEKKLIIEADGAFWHQDQGADIRRDKEILQELGEDWLIYHMHFYSKRHSPKLELNPISNSYYVSVNPGVKSYCDPGTFEKTKVIDIETVKYERKRGPGWIVCPKPVYDLQVKDVHSYYANGVLISNCYVEYGTDWNLFTKGPMPARPYVRPGSDRALAQLDVLERQARDLNDLLRLLALKMEYEMKKVVEEKSIIDTGNLWRSITAEKM